MSMGIQCPDELEITLADLMESVMVGAPSHPPDYGIIKNLEGVDLMPANINLAGLESRLMNAMSREYVMRDWLDVVKRTGQYDYVLIDCMPSLNVLTIGALASANSVIVPCQANYLSTKGLKQLVTSIIRVKHRINPRLKVDGILLTMVDRRTKNATTIITALREINSGLHVMNTEIPFSVRVAESSNEGRSIFSHDSKGKVAAAYDALTKEVMHFERQPDRPRTERSR